MTDGSVARRVVALAGLALSLFAFNTAENLPIGLLDLMSRDVGVSLSAIGLLVSCSALVVAGTSLPLAYWSGRVPRRYLLIVVLGVLVVSTWASAASDSYAVLVTARTAGAVAQALFAAVLVPAAVGLFSARVRGRVIGFIFASGSLATVLGVPAGTWLGHHEGWRVSFYALTALTVVCLLAVGLCVPTTRPGASHADVGVTPDRRRYSVVLATTVLSVTGAFTAFTYVTPFLRDVGGFGPDAVSALLTTFGAGGITGVLLVGVVTERAPRLVVAVPVTGQAVALGCLYAFGDRPAVTTLGVLALGLTAAPVYAATSSRVLRVAPGRTDVASAANSAAFNLGLAAGGALGGAVITFSSVRHTFAVGTALSVVAAAVVWGERFLDRDTVAAA